MFNPLKNELWEYLKNLNDLSPPHAQEIEFRLMLDAIECEFSEK